jgi:hypothetical protein
MFAMDADEPTKAAEARKALVEDGDVVVRSRVLARSAFV